MTRGIRWILSGLLIAAGASVGLAPDRAEAADGEARAGVQFKKGRQAALRRALQRRTPRMPHAVDRPPPPGQPRALRPSHPPRRLGDRDNLAHPDKAHSTRVDGVVLAEH